MQALAPSVSSSGRVKGYAKSAAFGGRRPRATCGAVSTKVVKKDWWKPKPAYQMPDGSVPPSYPTKEAREALFGVPTEQIEAVGVTIQGQLPAWLAGSLVANGGGDYTGTNHMFDGYASIAKVEFSNGQAKASHRMLDTRAYRAVKQTGRAAYREFSSVVPATTRQEKLQGALDMVKALVLGNKDAVFTDNASVNVLPLGDGTLLAISEAEPSQYRVDPTTLQTLSQVRLSGDGVSGDIQTAHPTALPDGRLLNFTYTAPFGAYTVYTQDPTTLRRTKLASIPFRSPLCTGWMHSFAATTQHAILIEPPLYMNLGSIITGTPTDCVFMDWKPTDPTRVHVVPLDGSGKVRTYTLPPLWVFHFGNAFESANGRYLYVDFAAFDNPAIINDLLLANCRKDFPASISPSGYRRLTIPLADEQSANGMYGDVRPELLIPPSRLLDDESAHGNYAEFPAYNPAYFGKPYRYAYIMSVVRPSNLGNAITKIDLETKSVKTWHQPGWLTSEPKFVAAPTPEAEDEGVVMFFATSAEGASRLVLLDAASFEQLALLELPFNAPQRFHGSFIPTKQ